MSDQTRDAFLDDALDFIAGNPIQRPNGPDDDLFAWMLVNGDLGAAIPSAGTSFSHPPTSPTLFPFANPGEELRAFTPTVAPSIDGDGLIHPKVPSPAAIPAFRENYEFSSIQPAAHTSPDGILHAALQRAAGLRSGAQAAIVSGWKSFAAKIGLQGSNQSEVGGAQRSNPVDLATLLDSTGDPFSFTQPQSQKRKRSQVSAASVSVPPSGRGKRRRPDQSPPVIQHPVAVRKPSPTSETSAEDKKIAVPSSSKLHTKSSDLQKKVSELTMENAALRAQLQAVSSNQSTDANELEESRKKHIQTIKEMLSSGASDGELRRVILQYKDLYSDYGRFRRIAVKHHLRALKHLLLPSNVTRVSMWSVAEASRATSKSADITTSPLWQQLLTACEITPAQIASIAEMNDSVAKRRAEFAEVLSVFRILEDKALVNIEGLEFQMNLLMSHLSVRQLGLFLQWLESNKAALAGVTPVAAWPQAPASDSTDKHDTAAHSDPIQEAAAVRANLARSRRRRGSSVDTYPLSSAAIPAAAANKAVASADSLTTGARAFGAGLLRAIPIPTIISNVTNTVSNALPSLPPALHFLSSREPPATDSDS